MKILALYPFVPYPLTSGVNQRTFYLLKYLAERHDVTFVALHTSGRTYEDIFKTLCRRIEIVPFKHPPWEKLLSRLSKPLPQTILHWYNKDVEIIISQILKKEHFDLIHCEDICMVQYILNTKIPIIVDRNRVDLSYQQEKLQYLNLNSIQRIAYKENLLKLKKFEINISKHVAAELVCSIDDFNFIKKEINVNCNLFIMENGVDEKIFYPRAEIIPQKNNLTFTGTMNYYPNVDGMNWFIGNIFPTIQKNFPQVDLWIVGGNPAPTIIEKDKLPNIHVTGFVEDIVPFYCKAEVYLAPIRIGGGTRLKIVEAMAVGRPVVSTTIGCQGLGFTSGQELIIADTKEEFSKAVCELIENDAKREIIAQDGLEVVRERLTWSKLVNKYLKFIETIY